MLPTKTPSHVCARSCRVHWWHASSCGEVFAPLRDVAVFNAVELDPTFGTIQWPTGADFDPETLHDWPKYRDELIAMARRWSSPSVQNPNGRANNAYLDSSVK